MKWIDCFATQYFFQLSYLGILGTSFENSFEWNWECSSRIDSTHKNDEKISWACLYIDYITFISKIYGCVVYV